MKVINYLIVILAVLSLTLTSCKKDDNNTVTPTNPGGSGGVTQAPTASFDITGDNSFAPASIQFNNTSTNATSYSWDFGDGNTSTDVSPTHTYTSAGTYTVKLTASNGNGETANQSKTVTVLAPPTSLKITRIDLLKFPYYDASNQSWDSGINGYSPDIYFKIHDVNGTVLYDHTASNRVENVPENGSCWWYNLSLTVSNLSGSYYFAFYDYDSANSDDYMGSSLPFIFDQYPTYPSTVTVNGQKFTVKLTVTWIA